MLLTNTLPLIKSLGVFPSGYAFLRSTMPLIILKIYGSSPYTCAISYGDLFYLLLLILVRYKAQSVSRGLG